MAAIEEFVRERSPLSINQIHKLRELVADWQLLSDLSILCRFSFVGALAKRL